MYQAANIEVGRNNGSSGLIDYLSEIVEKSKEHAKKLKEEGVNGKNIMVLLPCHGVYVGHGHSLEDFSNPENWYTSYPQDVSHYIGHIVSSYVISQELVKAGADVTLVISGGNVRKSINGKVKEPPMERSEASSYQIILEHMHRILSENTIYGNKTSTPSFRTVVEENAVSSYENLILGLREYVRTHQQLPYMVVAVGWGFKEERFKQYANRHDIPLYYIGINNPDREDLEKAIEAEKKIIRIILENGPLAKELVEKRNGRGQPDEISRVLNDINRRDEVPLNFYQLPEYFSNN